MPLRARAHLLDLDRSLQISATRIDSVEACATGIPAYRLCTGRGPSTTPTADEVGKLRNNAGPGTAARLMCTRCVHASGPIFLVRREMYQAFVRKAGLFARKTFSVASVSAKGCPFGVELAMRPGDPCDRE
jgi:hypothetical protein